MAVSLLAGADESLYQAAAHALSFVPPDKVTVDVPLLASHPSDWLRALAAVVWSRRPELGWAIGERLARDPSRPVRFSLASSLRAGEPNHRQAIEIARHDPRRSVRRVVQARED
jgi:hypothetical protein